MSATDELRRLLDERGVEWSSIVGDTAWTDSRGWTATAEADSVDGSMAYVTAPMTPEQAIAATLGWGKLTADDVRDLIEWHSDASGGNGRIFHNGAYVEIANELNATLGRETCRIVEDRASDTDAYWESTLVMECGAEFVWAGSDNPIYCPYCGGKVVE